MEEDDIAISVPEFTSSLDFSSSTVSFSIGKGAVIMEGDHQIGTFTMTATDIAVVNIRNVRVQTGTLTLTGGAITMMLPASVT